jgi:hypothetical protein
MKLECSKGRMMTHETVRAVCGKEQRPGKRKSSFSGIRHARCLQMMKNGEADQGLMHSDKVWTNQDAEPYEPRAMEAEQEDEKASATGKTRIDSGQ